MMRTALLAGILVGGPALSQEVDRPPEFRECPVTEVFSGTPADPIFSTGEQRHYRTRIRAGVSNRSGVWNGSWKNPVETRGPNFAGHYFVIRWGCGSQCVMMAVVDAVTGTVYGSPLREGGELSIAFDLLGDMDLDFRRDSSLMIVRNGCRPARKECGIYYFDWRDDHFVLLKRTLIDLTKAESNK